MQKLLKSSTVRQRLEPGAKSCEKRGGDDLRRGRQARKGAGEGGGGGGGGVVGGGSCPPPEGREGGALCNARGWGEGAALQAGGAPHSPTAALHPRREEIGAGGVKLTRDPSQKGRCNCNLHPPTHRSSLEWGGSQCPPPHSQSLQSKGGGRRKEKKMPRGRGRERGDPLPPGQPPPRCIPANLPLGRGVPFAAGGVGG